MEHPKCVCVQVVERETHIIRVVLHLVCAGVRFISLYPKSSFEEKWEN